MKTKLILSILNIFLFSVVASSQAKSELHPDDVLVIEYIETRNGSAKSIVIGDVYKLEGDRFVAKEEIKWSNTINSISVINIRTGKTIIFMSDHFESKPKSVYAAYLKKPRTGSKGASIKEKVHQMKTFLSQEFYILEDNIMIYSSLIIDNQHTYYMRPLGQPQARAFELMKNPDEPNIIYIPISQLKENNIDIFNHSGCSFQINYIGDNDNIFITDSFRLINYN